MLERKEEFYDREKMDKYKKKKVWINGHYKTTMKGHLGKDNKIIRKWIPGYYKNVLIKVVEE